MDDHRFDDLTRALARPASRRTAALGAVVVLMGMTLGRVRHPGAAQGVASPMALPGATPASSPSPLNLLAGTPRAAGAGLQRQGDICTVGDIPDVCCEPSRCASRSCLRQPCGEPGAVPIRTCMCGDTAR